MTPEENSIPVEVAYIGDPMCSWCWAISPELIRLQEYCAQQGLGFRVIVGGLRPGGGDPWNQEFKSFLREHWQHIGKLTGRSFSLDILESDYFDYDTEPACRSVVTARSMLEGSELGFFIEVQRKFYVENEDPKDVEFYRSICSKFDLDYGTFAERFESPGLKEAVRQEFKTGRRWGVSGFPSVLLLQGQERSLVSNGFATFEKIRENLNQLIRQPTPAC